MKKNISGDIIGLQYPSLVMVRPITSGGADAEAIRASNARPGGAGTTMV